MAEVVVADQEDAEPSSTEQSAHEAAVAEGASAVQAEQAAEAAEEAKAAAELALEAAKINTESGAEVAEAAIKAEGSAAASQVNAEMIHEALLGMKGSIDVLVEELKASRKAAQPPADGSRRRPPREREPGEGSGHWFYGR